ncbi:MAG: hypothetical protein Kow0013_17600 [Pararhodobacter sp.]
MRAGRTRALGTRADRGLTLLELLAALAVLAAVSVMAVQTLGGTLFQRDVLTRLDTEGRGLIRAMALLRHDLEAVIPLTTGTGEGRVPVLSASRQGMTLARAGVAMGGAGSGFAIIEWRLDSQGRLTRQVRPDAVTGEDPSPQVPVLDDVRAFALRPRGGAMPDGEDPAFLPAGFELTLEHARFGTLTLVVAR